MEPADVLAGLDPEQRMAAEAVRGPVCILAGAGTGKTRAITHRIAYAALTGAVPPTRMLAVTFTTRAAGELRVRLRGLGVEGVQARTFHSAALRQLDHFWPRAVGGSRPRLVESKLRLVAEAARRVGLRLQQAELRDLAAELEWARSTLVPLGGYPAAASAAGREPPVPPDSVDRLLREFEEVKRGAGVLDFEDVLLLTAALLEERSDVAAEVRDRYRWFVVDEYQDVNPLQQRLLEAWLGGREELCVVGDPEQTIYTFTGARPDYLLEFPRRHRGAQVLRLVRDYRSTPQVVAMANAVASGGPGVTLVAQRPDGPEPTITSYADEPAEGEAVARRIAGLVRDGVPPHRIAVLYRVHAQSEVYEQALAAAALPYQVAGSARFFERPEVREALRLLRAATRSADAGDPEVGLAGLVGHVLSAAGWSAREPTGTGAVRERWESLNALVGLAEGSPGLDLPGFVAELETRAEQQHAPTSEGVVLASLHAAKGLEWDTVFLVGLTEGTLPIVHARTPAQVEEERRLLYVGITRAERVLHLSWAASRNPGGRGTRRPSRFLLPLLPPSASPPAQRRRARGEPTAESANPALFAELRAWRAARAQEQHQPAFCVFSDATLEEIASVRPQSVAELVTVRGVGQAKLDRYGADVLRICGSSAGAAGDARENALRGQPQLP